jgi:hypothetical protein
MWIGNYKSVAIAVLLIFLSGCIGQEELEVTEAPELDLETLELDRLIVESEFKVSGSGTGYAAIISVHDESDVNDIRLGINSDPGIGGFWLRVAKEGEMSDYNLGTADVGYHWYKIEYDQGTVRVYIDGDLKKTVFVKLIQPRISLHANARAQGDTVSVQFREIRVDATFPDNNEVHFRDHFDDETIYLLWTIENPPWMSVTEQSGVLDMSGSAEHDMWGPGGTATFTLIEALEG